MNESQETMTSPAGEADVVEVGRSAGVFAVVALGAAALAVAYLVRGVGGSAVAVLVALVLAALAVGAAAAWWDARSPLLVADRLGVRVRQAKTWRGLPWEDVDHVVLVEPRGPLSDGSLDVVARDGSVFVVALGLAVRANRDDLAGALRLLSGDEAIVVAPQREDDDPQAVVEEPAAVVEQEPVVDEAPAEPEPEPEPRTLEPRPEAVRADVGSVHSLGSSALAPGFRVVTALRASRGRPELVIERLDERQASEIAEAPQVPATSQTPEPGTADGEAESDTAEVEAPERPLGAMLRQARERVGMSVDDLAERTSIRPHVIEALEDDDPAPCGGDFYARGHLRAIAATVGQDPGPWLAVYDAGYAHAPVPARAVFEAERATGATSIRVAHGGRSWVALTVAVLVLAIIWGIGQLVVGRTNDDAPASVPTSVAPSAAAPSAGGSLAALGAPVTNHLVLRGDEAKPTRVVVTDEQGRTVWTGLLAKGDRQRVDVVGPATVTAGRGDAASVGVNGKKAKPVGDGPSKTSRSVGSS